MRVSVKRKTGDDLTSRPSKLIRSELHKLDGHLLHSEDIRSVAQSLYRARRKIHPGLPKSREDVHNAIELMDTQPKLIHADFELTMHTVLNDVFPVASLKCCRFHLGQAWYRKMQNLGLSQDYKDSDSEIGKWL